MATKIPLLSWSGGVDSTANVISNFSHKIPFETIYIKLPNNEIQQKYELKARKRILKELTKIFGNYHIKDTELDFVGTLAGTGKFVQPYIWATSISYNIDMDKYSQLVFGYIKEYDFWHVKSEFQAVIWASHNLLLADGDVPEFFYPLEWVDKASVIRDYYNYDKRVKPILELTYYCEKGKSKPCGKCKKCKEFKIAKKEAK